MVVALLLGSMVLVGCAKTVELAETNATCQRARAAGAGDCSIARDILMKGEANAREAQELIDNGGDSEKAQELADSALDLCKEAEKLAQSDQCQDELGGGAGGSSMDLSELSDEELAAQLKDLSVSEVIGKLDTVYFDFDRSSLTPRAKSTLDTNARILKARGDVDVVVSGHCDERGTDEYNRALGARRAETVKSYLSNAGVGGSRLKTVSYGEDEPVDSGHDEAAWAKNRRAEFGVR